MFLKRMNDVPHTITFSIWEYILHKKHLRRTDSIIYISHYVSHTELSAILIFMSFSPFSIGIFHFDEICGALQSAG